MGLKQHLISRKCIAGIVFILILSLLVIFPEIIPWYSNHNMKWDVEVGDQFTLNVTYTAIQSVDSSWSEFAMVDFVGVEVVFEITALPDIPRILRSEGFLDMVSSIKVSCYFPNGSQLQSQDSLHLTTYVSYCLLPVNGTILLDSLYPNMDTTTLEGPEGTFHYFQEKDSNSMIIGESIFHYYQFGHGGYGTGWYGEVSQETGIPSHIVIEVYSPLSTGPFIHERLVLSSVSQVA